MTLIFVRNIFFSIVLNFPTSKGLCSQQKRFTSNQSQSVVSRSREQQRAQIDRQRADVYLYPFNRTEEVNHSPMTSDQTTPGKTVTVTLAGWLSPRSRTQIDGSSSVNVNPRAEMRDGTRRGCNRRCVTLTSEATPFCLNARRQPLFTLVRRQPIPPTPSRR